MLLMKSAALAMAQGQGHQEEEFCHRRITHLQEREHLAHYLLVPIAAKISFFCGAKLAPVFPNRPRCHSRNRSAHSSW